MRRRAVTALAAAAALAPVAGGAVVAFRGDTTEPAGSLVDDERGVYRRLGISDTAERVIDVLGDPDRSPGFAPVGESPAEEIASPSSARTTDSGRRELLRGRRRSTVARRRREQDPSGDRDSAGRLERRDRLRKDDHGDYCGEEWL